MFTKLVSFLRAQYPQFGFQEVITPTIYKKSLWQKSGHWENYADDMFEVRGRGASGEKADAQIGEDEEFGLKPMNCPGHCLLFASEKRSYRDLPIRYADFSPLHRNETSGALSGLTRVRRFHQDDGHIFCRPSQIAEEIRNSLDFVGMVYETFGLGPYKLVLSTRPEDHYIGTLEEWERAEEQLKSALQGSGREWTINDGDGAFYGPKIDIILRDSDGKEHQTATIQLDFQLPQRFGLEYVAPAPEVDRQGTADSVTDNEISKGSGTARPVIIHRAILGSVERFMALLIEHYAGVYPFWLSPRPLIILSVSQDEAELRHITELAALLGGVNKRERSRPAAQITGRIPMHVDTDTSARSLGKKIREAKKKGYNFIAVVGPKDAEKKTLQLEVHHQRSPEQMRQVLVDHVGGLGDGSSRSKSFELTCEAARNLFSQLEDEYM